MKAYYKSPVGIICIEDNQNFIKSLIFVDKEENADSQNLSDVLSDAIKQLEAYFAGKRKDFDLPLLLEGTEFQKKSWDYLLSIPYGETVTYKQQSETISTAKACRAVGSANGKNPIAIIVPCHRVVNVGGGLGGFAYGLDIKRELLALERQFKGGGNELF